MFLSVPILHLGMVKQVSDLKETCSASPPAAVMVVTAVGIEPGPPTYKPCLLITTLLWLKERKWCHTPTPSLEIVRYLTFSVFTDFQLPLGNFV